MDYERYDCLRYELFETLIPAMLYKGTEKERDEFFGFLKQDGKVFIHFYFHHITLISTIYCGYIFFLQRVMTAEIQGGIL